MSALHIWEFISDDAPGSVYRMAVPGGWLYRIGCLNDVVTFVPAVDAPGTAEVTEAAVDAAIRVFEDYDGPDRVWMRAAIEAADRARGLRP